MKQKKDNRAEYSGRQGVKRQPGKRAIGKK